MNQEDIINFLRKNKALLDKEDFEQLYRRCNFYAAGGGADVRDFTLFFQQNGVDPLSYMHEVPECYLSLDTGLTEIDIPEGVEQIGENAFYGCKNLQRVYIPASVSRIYAFAFSRCANLHTITYGGTMGQWETIYKTLGWDFEASTYTIQCTDGDMAGGWITIK